MPGRRSAHTLAPSAGADDVVARAAAMALLARRDFSSKELRAKLDAKGFATAATEVVIADLTREGLLNDERYAQHYVAYHAGRGRGPVRITAELRRRGLAAELIVAALESGPDWSALARKVCRAKFGSQPAVSWAQRARQARFLQYRGFSSDDIRAATGAEPETGSTDL